MELGSIVKSTSGHDKDSFYLVVKLDNKGVYIADGRRRKLAKPKCKNEKHLMKTNRVVDLADVDTDKKIRRVLWEYNFPHQPVAE
jgi:ribosomal protein L14E/L6E/L27E